ncbi:MAG: hypothetical protein EOP38_13100 [Rubrivivax sp.]|nr:MAG: hypothetical protein EOP38_13100 [Rubrivivax sp.]
MHYRPLSARFLQTAASAAGTLLILASSPAMAVEKTLPTVDRVGIWLGGYHVDAEGDLNVASRDGTQSTGPQRIIDGTDTVKRARIDWLLFDQQGFSIDLYRYSRTDNAGVSQPFTFNGQTYTATGQVGAKTTFDIGNFSYRWWFGGEDTKAGLGVGAAYYKAKLNLNASATVGGATQSIVDEQSKSTWAPLLTLGVRHRISDQVRLYADVSGARKNGDDTGGDIVNAAAGVEWFPWRNVGLGAEYSATRIRMNYRDDDVQAHLKLRLQGPALYLRMRF